MDPATVLHWMHPVPPCSPSDPCHVPADRFRSDPGLHAIAVVEAGRPLALLTRSEFLSAWAGRYSYSLLHDRTLAEWLEHTVHRPVPTIQADATLEKAALGLRRDPASDHCLVVLKEGRYGGLLSRVAVMEGLLEQSRRHAQDLAQARDDAIEGDRAKSIFLATISHEIRTPLNGILGCSELLRSEVSDPAQAELASLILGCGRTLHTLLNDLIDASRLEAGRVVLDPQPFDVGACIEDVVGLLGVPARSKGLSMELHLDPRLPSRVVADQVRIRQVLSNLVGNAVKFTDAGVVRIRATPCEGALVEVQVIDTGPGIPEDVLPRLFQPFMQGDGSFSRLHGGAGLGLSISRQLAELLGGTIHVASVRGQGSMFTFTFSHDGEGHGSGGRPAVRTTGPRAPRPEMPVR